MERSIAGDPGDFDLVVLGGGSAGYVGAICGARMGMRVLVLDPGPLGGTCLNEGCIPTKSLLEVAGFLRSLGEAERFGVTVPSREIDGGRLEAFGKGVVDRLIRGIDLLFKKHGIAHLPSKGRLVSSGLVRIPGNPDREISTRFVLLATGSRPRPLGTLPFDGVRILSSTDLLKLRTYPSRMAIVGGGAIGCEFADILEAFGVGVTLLEREPRLLPQDESEIAGILDREFQSRGISVLTGVAGLEREEDGSEPGIRLAGTVNGKRQRVDVDAVLVAIGRDPVSDTLGLHEAGLRTGPGGFVPVGSDGQTALPGVYAAGDLTGGYLLAHKASREAIVAVESMAGKSPEPLDPRTIPRVVYTHPEVVSIGLTREQAERAGYVVEEVRVPLLGNARSLIQGSRRGLFKALSDKKTGRILGCHGIGPHLSEMIAMVSQAMPEADGVARLSRAVFPHPSVSEALQEAFLEIGRLSDNR